MTEVLVAGGAADVVELVAYTFVVELGVVVVMEECDVVAASTEVVGVEDVDVDVDEAVVDIGVIPIVVSTDGVPWVDHVSHASCPNKDSELTSETQDEVSRSTVCFLIIAINAIVQIQRGIWTFCDPFAASHIVECTVYAEPRAFGAFP